MKMIVVAVLALVVVAAAAPQGSPAPAAAPQGSPAQAAAPQGSPAQAAAPEPVKILRSEFDQQPDGPYTFNFESDDGISRQEEGSLKEVVDEENKPQTVVVVKGTYSFPGEDGKPVVVSYYADETGFHAEGDSIPKAA